jgi:DNA-binding NarL/FixJ family response regulator
MVTNLHEEQEEAVVAIKVILADDHKIVRDGLQALLEKDSEFEVIGTASNGQIACDLVGKLNPDILVIDIGMPVMNGIEATEKIIAERPQMRVIALSMHSDRRFVLSMFEAGASGYLLKDCAFDELTRAIRQVHSGKRYISPALMGINEQMQ